MDVQRPTVLDVLARGPAAAMQLAHSLDTHRTTVSRILKPLQRSDHVVRLLGRTRGARYGLARNVGAVGSSRPLYAVDREGAPVEIGTLHAIAPEHFAVRGGPVRIDGLTHGIPYFLQDARPAMEGSIAGV